MRPLLCWLSFLAAAGCFQPTSSATVSDEPGGCQGCRHSSTAVGGPGGGSSGRSGSSSATASSSSGTTASSSSSFGSGASSSTAGSSGGSSSGGSSSGDGGLICGSNLCPAVLVPPPQLTCPTGDLGLSSQVVDIIDCNIIGGANMVGLDPNGVPYPGAAATSNATNGTVAICAPEQGAVTIEGTAGGYPTTYFAELNNFADQCVTQLGLVSTQTLTSLSALFPGGLDLTKGFVIVKTNTGKQCDTSGAGWTFGITLPDGGGLPDGGYALVYSETTGIPTVGLTKTSASGTGFFYNIDPLLSDFFVITYQNPPEVAADGGACAPQNTALGMTGRLYVAGNAISVFPIFIP